MIQTQCRHNASLRTKVAPGIAITPLPSDTYPNHCCFSFVQEARQHSHSIDSPVSYMLQVRFCELEWRQKNPKGHHQAQTKRMIGNAILFFVCRGLVAWSIECGADLSPMVGLELARSIAEKSVLAAATPRSCRHLIGGAVTSQAFDWWCCCLSGI